MREYCPGYEGNEDPYTVLDFLPLWSGFLGEMVKVVTAVSSYASYPQLDVNVTKSDISKFRSLDHSFENRFECRACVAPRSVPPGSSGRVQACEEGVRSGPTVLYFL